MPQGGVRGPLVAGVRGCGRSSARESSSRAWCPACRRDLHPRSRKHPPPGHGARLRLEDVSGAGPGQPPAPRAHGADRDHRHPAVEIGDVDGHPHAEGVHSRGRSQQHRPSGEGQTPQQPPASGPEGRGHLDGDPRGFPPVRRAHDQRSRPVEPSTAHRSPLPFRRAADGIAAPSGTSGVSGGREASRPAPRRRGVSGLYQAGWVPASLSRVARARRSDRVSSEPIDSREQSGAKWCRAVEGAARRRSGGPRGPARCSAGVDRPRGGFGRGANEPARIGHRSPDGYEE